MDSNGQERTGADLISRTEALKAIERVPTYGDGMVFEALSHVQRDVALLPSAQRERLTDAEQRIFLKAIEREEKVCKKVDEEWGSDDEEYEINLVHVCHEIIRKVKGTLWT